MPSTGRAVGAAGAGRARGPRRPGINVSLCVSPIPSSPRRAGPADPAGRPGRRPRLPLGGRPRSKFCLLLSCRTLSSPPSSRVWSEEGSLGRVTPSPASFRFPRRIAPRPLAALPASLRAAPFPNPGDPRPPSGLRPRIPPCGEPSPRGRVQVSPLWPMETLLNPSWQHPQYSPSVLSEPAAVPSLLSLSLKQIKYGLILNYPFARISTVTKCQLHFSVLPDFEKC